MNFSVQTVTRRFPERSRSVRASWVGIALCCCTAAAQAQNGAGRFVQEIPDAGQGAYVKCDLQFRFFDPDLSAAQFVAKAVDGGCRVVVVSPAAPPETSESMSRFLREVEAARKAFPDVIVLPGYAWAIRAPGISTWATIVLPPGEDFAARYREIPGQLIAPDSETTSAAAVGESLRLLCPESMPADRRPVIIFDQRRDGTTVHRWAVEQNDAERLWSADPELLRDPIGQGGLLDRWDQSEMRSGGDWDQLLADGWNVGTAADDLDLAQQPAARNKPGEFTETWLRLTEFTSERAFQALRLGAFFGVRGGAARDVELTVTSPALPRPAYAGETVDLPAGTPIRLQLSLTIPNRDWKEMPHRLDVVELIGVTPVDSRILRKESPKNGRITLDYDTEVPEGGILFRAMGYREIDDGANYGFYTNAVRIVADGRWERPAVDIKPQHWLSEDSGLWVACLLCVMSFSVVGAWLVQTGKMSLLLGDSLQPVQRRWKSSRTRRTLLHWFPWLRHHATEESDTIGTSLSQREQRVILVAFLVCTAILGAIAGETLWSDAQFASALPGGLPAGILAGATVGAALGGVLRFHPISGLGLYLLLRTVAAARPDANLDSCLFPLLMTSLLGFLAQQPLQTGTLRWPADSPVVALLGLFGLIVVATAIAAFAPGLAGIGALTIGLAAGGVWLVPNLRLGNAPLRLLSISFLTILWFGGALAQGFASGDGPSLSRGLYVLVEALGLGVLWAASRPGRLDAAGIVLTQSALAWLIAQGIPESAGSEAMFLAAIGGIGALSFFVAEPAVHLKLLTGIALAALGRLLLFTPQQPGLWLLGSLACAAAALASSHRFRMLLFLLPYVLIGGFWTMEETPRQAADETAPVCLAAAMNREVAALRTTGEPALKTMRTAGQFVSLFALAGLSALVWSLRPRQPPDIFDGAGRVSLAALAFCGACFALDLPLYAVEAVAAVSLIGLWSAHLRSDLLTASPPVEPDADEQQIWQGLRIRLGLAAAVFAGLLAYGSLVPFQWRDHPWIEAVQNFQAQIHAERDWIRLSSDRLVNVLLTVPLGCCLYGAMTLGRRGWGRRAWCALEALQMSILVSVLVETAQHWSVGRVASVDDVISQTIGAVLGIILWVVAIERLMVNWVAAWLRSSSEGRWAQLLWIYLLGVLVLAVLPAGMPVTSPKQLYDRFRDGRLSPIPFADCVTAGDIAKDAIVGLLLFFPVGMWGALAFRKAGQPLNSILRAVGYGLGYAALITVVRGLCSAKPTDSSWLLTGLIGSACGAAAMHYAVEGALNRYANLRSGLNWWGAAAMFAALTAGYYLHPWVFDAAPERVTSGWEQFVNTPFAAFHTGNDWLLIEELARKLAWFGALGILLGQAICRSSEHTSRRIFGGMLAIILTVVTALGIEIGQLHQTTRSPEITDVLIYITGALLGLWVRFTWLDDRELFRVPVARGKAAGVPTVLPPATMGAVLQTAVAVGLALGLLSALAVLFLRR